ncbi:IS66 family transposase zinc-finger binding domain-containing protein [Globicatella sulfidifaciens]
MKAHKRKAKKNKGIKRAIFDQFPAEEKLHELSNCQCPDCGESMKQIGTSAVREELVFIPAHMKRIIHKQASYKCEGCTQKEGANGKIVKAPVPKAPLNNSLGSASLIAQTIHQKFGLKLPAYRQEQEWKICP